MQTRFAVQLAAGLASVSAFLLIAQQSPVRVTTAVLTKAPPEEWVTHGRDYAETHFSPLKQIDAANVSKLGLAWTFETNSATGNIEGNPLVQDGIMYGSLTNSVLYAINARTGQFKWRWDPEIPSQGVITDKEGKRVRVGPSVCCGRVNRGVALYNGKIFAGLLDGRLVAINADSGKLEWETQTTPKESDYSITGAPRVVKGKVIIGASGAEYAMRGYVSAYETESGNMAWRFYTVPGDPSKPFENKAMEMAAKTWKGEWWKYGGGGTVWDGMAYDPDLDLLYIGTGNGGPWVQEIRSPGGGDNLFLSSILALRPDTGEYVWHYQVTPGDNWDYTAVQPLMLADLEIGGRTRKVIMQAPKNGFFYVIDRTNGQFISAYAFANVTWAKGVDQKTGRPIESEIARFGTEGTSLSPGPGGAHNWHAMSFNPATKLVYIPGNESSFFYRKDSNFNFKENDAAMNWGIVLGGPAPAAPNPAPPGPATAEPPRPVTGGFLLAWNPVTQKEVWRHRTGSFGGSLSTAGGLVFAGTNDGTFHAYDAAKGDELWKMQITRGNFANPISYTLDGKQYVSVLAGGPNARVFTFVLDGQAPIPPLPAVGFGKGKAK